MRDLQHTNDDLDKSLLIWFKQVNSQRASGWPTTAREGQQAAERHGFWPYCLQSMDRQMEKRTFGGQSTYGWWIISHEYDRSEPMENWGSRAIAVKYAKKNVFNMDETGLFYCLMTDKTLSFKGEKCSGGKLSKERLAVALCANMSGTEKMEPIHLCTEWYGWQCETNPAETNIYFWLFGQ